ncbi:MAG TPA: universal stress protein, partial [Candidatus Limnocylindria bacterium]|nr:universal stress protein [Candidatus Limnocylindria bacterium]
MRILVGLDGSTASRIATDFVAGRSWPAGTRIRLLCAVEPHVDWTGLAPVANDTTEADRALLSDVLDERAEALRSPSHVVESFLENGRAADLLMAHAGEWMADLIVVGNRGLGAAASAILGSVSAHLVDNAPCPVLVARSPSITRVLLATDGTESSRSIPRILAAWGQAFRGVAVEVLSVAAEEDLPSRGLPGEPSEEVAEYELHRQIAEE